MNSINSLSKFWNVIINPTTLKGKSIKYWKTLATSLIYDGYEFVEWHTNHKSNAVDITVDLLKEGNRQLMIVGGDGTLNEVVNGVMKSGISSHEVTLCLIPSGTGNDWARNHKIKRDIKVISSLLTSGNTKLHDVGIVRSIRTSVSSTRYFINIAGFGFDAAVIQRVHEARKYKMGNGFIYLKNVLFTLFKSKSVECKIEIESKIIEKSVFSIAIGICKYNGNGMKQVPMAKFDDGLFDIILIEKMSVLTMLYLIPKLFNGTHINHSKIHHFTGSKITIFPKGRFFAEVEGELLEEGIYEIENCDSKIKVLVP